MVAVPLVTLNVMGTCATGMPFASATFTATGTSFPGGPDWASPDCSVSSVGIATVSLRIRSFAVSAT
jgi:hypothetical protein